MFEGCLIAALVFATYPIHRNMRANGRPTRDHSPTQPAGLLEQA
jgi:hypothetical protein